MHLAHPIKQEECHDWIGMPVCAVLHDGTRHYGIVSRTENGKLILNDQNGSQKTVKKHKKSKTLPKSSTKASNSRANATTVKTQISDYGDAFLDGIPDVESFGHEFSPFGDRLALNLTAIAFLFLIFI